MAGGAFLHHPIGEKAKPPEDPGGQEQEPGVRWDPLLRCNHGNLDGRALNLFHVLAKLVQNIYPWYIASVSIAEMDHSFSKNYWKCNAQQFWEADCIRMK